MVFSYFSKFLAAQFFGLRGEADVRAVNLICVMSGKNFREGIIMGQLQFSAETLGESGCLGVIEPAEDPMAKQTTGAKECLVDVGRSAVDRADDLEAEEIGEHPVGEVQDRADLFTIVGAAGHQCRIGILQNDNKSPVGVNAALICPEDDEFGL